jgi:uncharacterized protein
MSPRLTIDKRAIADICRRHHIHRLALFGSVLRDDFSADSHVDVLVEFEPGRPVGFAIFDVEEDLSRLLGGRRIDLVSRKYLNPRLRDRVLGEAETLCAEG